MRKAAGILMITYGVKTIVFLVSFVIREGTHHYPYLIPYPIYWSVIIISAIFIITGGVFCLKRKYWKICFASSLCLLLFMIFDTRLGVPRPVVVLFHINIFTWVDIPLSLAWGILPQIFVCLRKSEWQEISA
jgi:hypothetical protein